MRLQNNQDSYGLEDRDQSTGEFASLLSILIRTGYLYLLRRWKSSSEPVLKKRSPQTTVAGGVDSVEKEDGVDAYESWIFGMDTVLFVEHWLSESGQASSHHSAHREGKRNRSLARITNLSKF